MSTLFTKIIQGEIPCYKIAENESCLAFLDINPLKEGHTLVVPKLECDYIFDLPIEDYKQLMQFSKRVALAMKEVLPCNRIGVSVIGLEVPHAHVHLIPINSLMDMDFAGSRVALNPHDFAEIAQKIASKFR